MPKRKDTVQITLYGKATDRQKLMLLASHADMSQSEFLINQIREKFKKTFGDEGEKMVQSYEAHD